MQNKWIEVARSYLGLREYPGSPSNPTIMGWARRLGARILGMVYGGDHVPWCGLFVAYCIDQAGLHPPGIAVRASEWGKWGTALRQACPGAVLVFTRTGGGHVGFYVSEDMQNYHVLGGNQGDSVSITKIAKNRCSAIRWPAGAPDQPGQPRFGTLAGAVSSNEA